MFEADPSVGHRLLAPRIAYVIGTTGAKGPDLAPVSNLTSVSRSPQVIVIAVYKEWQTYANLREGSGFTVSVPHVG
jgi:flavin reductase (DIM6/NTAB) family NADH-FMN oxidoreductase RutF